MKLLRRRAKSFDIQVQDLVLHISAPEDYAEESRAAALSFWEQLQSYALRYPAFRDSKRPLDRITADAPDIVKEMVHAATSAGVGPMFTFRGAVLDQVARFLAEQLHEVTVACDGDYHIRSRKRMKLGVKRHGGAPITVALPPSQAGVGVSTTLGRGPGRRRSRRPRGHRRHVHAGRRRRRGRAGGARQARRHPSGAAVPAPGAGRARRGRRDRRQTSAWRAAWRSPREPSLQGHEGAGPGARRAGASRGQAARRGAARRDRAPSLPLPRARRPRGRRRRVRRVDARAPGARGPLPRAADAGLADRHGGRRRRRPVRAGHAPRPDALARQRLQLRGARRVGRADRAGGRRRGALRVRAQDRRGRVRADVRAAAGSCGRRPGATGGSARTSPSNVRTVRGIPRTLDGRRSAGDRRDPRRDVLPGRRVRGAQPPAARRRRQGLREPAQRRGRVAAAEGPEGHGHAAAAAVGPLVRVRPGHRVRLAPRVPRLGREGRAAGGAHDRGTRFDRRREGVPRALGGATGTRSTGRSTAP